MSQHLKGMILLLSAALIWGVAYIPTRYLGNNGISVFLELTLRYSFPFIIFGILDFKSIIKVPLHIIAKIMGAGLILFISITCSVYGIRMVQFGSLGILLLSLNVVFVPLYFVLFTKQKISTVLLAGSALSFIGTIILSIGNPQTPLNIGALLCLIASFGYTAYIIVCSKIMDFEVKATILQFYQSLVFILVAVPLLFLIPNALPTSLNFSDPLLIAAILFIGLAAGTFGYQFYFHGQKMTTPTITALVLSTQVIFSPLADLLLFKIKLSSVQILAYFCIILAVFLIPLESKLSRKVSK